MIHHVTGDLLKSLTDDRGPVAILHVVNDRGGWGKGFSGQISARWPDIKDAYKHWSTIRGASAHMPPFHLGFNLWTYTPDDNILIINMCAQGGYSTKTAPAFDLDALRDCLEEIAHELHHREQYGRPGYVTPAILMPRIGAGLGGGDWSAIEPVITEYLDDFDVTIYTREPS